MGLAPHASWCQDHDDFSWTSQQRNERQGRAMMAVRKTGPLMGAWAAVWAMLVPLVAAQPAPSALRPGATPEVVSRLPKPTVVPGELPRPCVDDLKKLKRLEYESPMAQSRWAGDPALLGALQYWAQAHFGMKMGQYQCLDLPYVVKKFHEASGDLPSSLLTERDVDRLTTAVAGGRAETLANAQVAHRQSVIDRPQTVVDFLPPGSDVYDLQCGTSAFNASRKLQRDISARIATMPPNMVRSATVGAIEKELKAQALIVAPAWQDLWKRQEALTQWAQRYNCRSDLRFVVEYWQASIGEPINAQDPSAVPRAEALIAKAEQELARFKDDQMRQLAQDAQSSGEAARAKSWALDDISGRTTLAQAQAAMPTALCSASGDVLTCQKAEACRAEADAYAAAKRRQEGVYLLRPINDMFWAPPPEVGQAVQAADVALQRCTTRFPYSAAAKSAVTFHGQLVTSAKLTFDARGLATMAMTLDAGVEAARNQLTRRLGLPETQQEIRTRMAPVSVGGGTAYAPGVGTVSVTPSTAMVPVQYSVTRYIWKAAGARVEEATGSFLFRFEAR